MKCEDVHREDEALHLLHAIYGLVQAARRFYLKFIEKLKKIGFKGGYPDLGIHFDFTKRRSFGIDARLTTRYTFLIFTRLLSYF